jgi:hypothetical protein
MIEGGLREQWRRDALLLGVLGHRFEDTWLPTVKVRLPLELAEAAWHRDDVGPLAPEDAAARPVRNRAATLALIGAAVGKRGRQAGDDVVVDLGAELIAQALNAAEDVAEHAADQA